MSPSFTTLRIEKEKQAGGKCNLTLNDSLSHFKICQILHECLNPITNKERIICLNSIQTLMYFILNIQYKKNRNRINFLQLDYSKATDPYKHRQTNYYAKVSFGSKTVLQITVRGNTLSLLTACKSWMPSSNL